MGRPGMVDKLKWYSPFVFLFGAIIGFVDPITDFLHWWNSTAQIIRHGLVWGSRL